MDALTAKAKSIGATVTTSSTNDPQAGAQAAAGADVALVFVFADSGESATVNGNAGDRNDLELWLNGSALVGLLILSATNYVNL